MTRLRRWAVVVAGTLLLVAVPVVLHHLPAAQSDVGAGRLLSMVEGSQDDGWSGYVVATGAIALPDASHFSDVAALFGGTSQLRVWWQDRDHWRVDRLETTGETDLIHDTVTTTEYDYEHATASISIDPGIRLPRTADLVPPELARRALADADPADVQRIPSRRVAGRSAPGLRVVPADPHSTIDHVDLWADPTSGVPLRVEVYASAHGHPAFTTTFRDFDAGRPADRLVTFTPTLATLVGHEDTLDIAAAANEYAPLRPPSSAGGLPESPASDGAVGVYGRGLTQVIAIPLRDREADPLRDQLLATPGVVQRKVPGDETTLVQVGILDVLLTGSEGNGGWLLAGTLRPAALARAAADVVHGYRFTGNP
jgi:hypothetical protein